MDDLRRRNRVDQFPDPANPVKPQLCIVGNKGTSVTITIAALGYVNNFVMPWFGMITAPERCPSDTILTGIPLSARSMTSGASM